MGRSAPGSSAAFRVRALTRPEHERPLRDLLVRLPQLATDASGRLDLPASSPSLVLEIAEHAETSVKVINLGIAALGNVLPYAAPEIEDGTIAMGTVEALGWLLAELSEVAASCLVLSAECRQARATLEETD
jgi:hypothetical protein